MRNLISLPAFAVIALSIFTSASYADTLVFDNSNFVGYVYGPPSSYTEMLDYGTSPGGRVSKFVLGYTTGSTPGTIWIRFYRYTDYSDPGYEIKQFALTAVPSANGYVDTYEYIIPEPDRFELPSGDFGYSLEFSRSTTQAALATGGSGIDRYFWEYDEWYDDFMPADFGVSYNFYFQVYTAPPIDEVTCDISGYKFDDADADSIWDAGESALSGWLVYVDTNNNDQYDTGAEPNAVTDQTGMYLFENLDAPATYTIREVMQNGWTQTFPGGPDYEYSVVVEPNNVYGPYNFGNTTQPQTLTISGYVKEDTAPLEGVYVEAYQNGDTPTGRSATTDSQGYYEIQLPTPWTGNLLVQKKGYLFDATTSYSNRTTNITENINGTFLYGGGDGTSSTPFEIWTAAQMNNIGRNPFDWDQHFILMADIDLGTYTGTAYNIIGVDGNSSFEGVFDGNNHSITNFRYATTVSANNIGLFGTVQFESAEIRDLRVNSPEINTPNAGYVGAIVGNLIHGTLTNCHVYGGSLHAYWHVGGIAGYTKNFYTVPEKGGTVLSCSASCNVEGMYSIQTFAGGLVGYHTGLIMNCSSSGNVQGYRSVGGLVGHAHMPAGPSESGYIYNSYATGQVTGTDSVGGLVGSNAYATVTNCYSTGKVTGDIGSDLIGGLCGDNPYALPFPGRFLGCFWNTETSDQDISYGGGTGLLTAEMQTQQTFLDAGWDFVDESANGTDDIWQMCPDGIGYPRLAYETINCEKYGGGSGTEEDPYQIWTAEQMNQIGLYQEDWSSYFILMDDIDLGMYQGTSYNIIGTTPFYDPVEEPFFGDFNGNGHSISNFTYQTTASMEFVGLFGAINDGEVHDLKVINPIINVPNADGVGAIVGYCGALIRDCGVFGGTVIGRNEVGGIIGETSYATMVRCANQASIQGEENIGGLVGYLKGFVYDCYSTGQVSASYKCGGLAGNIYQASRLNRCYAAGLVSGSSAGGLAGSGSGNFIRSFWDVTETNQTSSIGGTGLPTADLQRADTFIGWGCFDQWVLDAGNDYPRLSWEGTPGIPLPIPTYGGGSGSEEDPYLIYTVEQFNDIGLYECHQASHFKLMEDIVFDPDQDSNYSKIGENVSFYGVFDGNFHRIINPRYTQDDPAVNGTGIFKAIDGYHGDGVVKNLGVENPEITSAGNAVGGLAGSLVYGGTIDNCYVKGGSISGSDATGGLVGSVSMQNNNLVRNSYSNTIVSGNAHVGGLVSYFTGGTVEHSYAAGPVNGNSTTGGLVGYFDPAEVTVTESFYDSETTGQTGGLGTELATLQMQMLPSYTNWDFTNTWRICDGMNYPRLQWEPRPVGDFVCPEGVEINDLMILSDEWLVETMSADMAPEGGDGKVDLADWAHLTNAWMSSTGQADWDADCDIAPETPDGQINELDLTEFAGQWLYRSARFADIAPASAPDGRVDLLDYSLFSENWLLGVD